MAVAWSLVWVPIASPAVRPDILHGVCARQVLSAESGASVKSGVYAGEEWEEEGGWESSLETNSCWKT